MLAANSFPYRDVPISDADCDSALLALSRFSFVGVKEAYASSIRLALWKIGVSPKPEDFVKTKNEGWSVRQDRKEFIEKLNKDDRMRALIAEVNSCDVRLYEYAVARLCADLLASGLMEREDIVKEVLGVGGVCTYHYFD